MKNLGGYSIYIALGILILSLPIILLLRNSSPESEAHIENTVPQEEAVLLDTVLEEIPTVQHLRTPEPLKAVYISSWVAGTQSFKNKVVGLIDRTEINAVIIDVKDNTGKLSFIPHDPMLKELGVGEKRIRDIDALITELHAKNIYVIARIAVFQDPFYVKHNQSFAVRRTNGDIWVDRKNVPWIDPGAVEYWDYIVRVGNEAYARGFDELNFDYIRFPSDGNLKDAVYPYSKQIAKREILIPFFEMLHTTYKDTVPISADVFGMTTVGMDDLGIGQMIVDFGPYFDYIAPMVYPSHYASGAFNFKNPASEPYEVVKRSMVEAVSRLESIGVSKHKLRPWLQDFNMGATYTKEMVRDQIKGTYDSGLTSWMLWDPANTYTEEALLSN